MVTTFGNFPGVKVSTTGGGITSVAIGDDEILVLFGEASYQNDSDFSPGDGNEDPLESGLTGSTNTPETINARLEADDLFGSGSELADGMKEALANGANIGLLYGVAPQRFNVVDEVQSTQTGTLSNAPIWEEDVSDDSNISAIEFDDGGTLLDVRLTYDGSPATPSDADTVNVNPLTGEYAADAAPGTDFNVSYKYLDWSSAFDASAVNNVVNEDETGIYCAISDSDSVSSSIDGTVSTLRSNFKLVNAITGAEPNDNEQVTDSNGNFTRNDARYDTSNYDTANQSVDSDYHFKLAPVRLENTADTVLSGVGGLFAGNPINDPIYNDTLSGYQTVEQSLTKSEADDLRGENVIPIRQAGSIRVKDNTSTSTATDWERDFWRRRIADRVILIGKQIGDTIVGRINDQRTRRAARRLIRAELRNLVNDRLLKPNTSDSQNWFVDVYEDSTNADQVNIDIGFTPFGIVKRIDESITINT